MTLKQIKHLHELKFFTSSKASAYFLLWVCLNPANWVLRDNDVACACASTTTKAAQNRNLMLTILLQEPQETK